jgi:APA family basic amino acid/polyamine antiporter
MGQLTAKKSLDHIRRDFDGGELRRTLSAGNLVSLGVGAIIGAGIFVMTGQAAAEFAGPAVMLSFIVAGLACAFAALCYAELASTMPVSGSAYTYAYATLGEVFAWTMGWLLLLEYGVAASTVAVGWSGYVTSLLRDFGIDVPQQLSRSTIQLVNGELRFLPQLDLVGALGVLIVTGLLVIGIRESARVNNVIVAIKVTVLLAFVAVGVTYIDPANWSPFVPENQGGFQYGWQGVLRAASIIFFAYVGFEAVSTAAGESMRPHRDVPIGILGSLFICTLLYMIVSAVLTGVAPYALLGVPDPIAVAVDRMGLPWFSFVVKVGAITGLSSVMLVLTYAQTRVFYQMSRDGLLPTVFAHVHPRYRTPARGTILLGSVISVGAAVLPLRVLGDLVSLGTALAFAIVCVSVIYLRRHNPTLERPFRVPAYPLVPILGIVFCVVFMMGPILLDILSKAIGHDLLGSLFGSPGEVPRDSIALGILATYLLLGLLIYPLYGYRHSKVNEDITVGDRSFASEQSR